MMIVDPGISGAMTSSTASRKSSTRIRQRCSGETGGCDGIRRTAPPSFREESETVTLSLSDLRVRGVTSRVRKGSDKDAGVVSRPSARMQNTSSCTGFNLVPVAHAHGRSRPSGDRKCPCSWPAPTVRVGHAGGHALAAGWFAAVALQWSSPNRPPAPRAFFARWLVPCSGVSHWAVEGFSAAKRPAVPPWLLVHRARCPTPPSNKVMSSASFSTSAPKARAEALPDHR